MRLADLIVNALSLRAKIFENDTKNPMKAQERTLLKYLYRNRDTEFGKLYNFSSLQSIEDFRTAVPLSDYDTAYPYIQRMTKGEQNILTADKVTFFGITSGTTGHPKLIPVTKYSRDRKSDLMNIWAYYLLKNHPNIFDGKILGIISPEIKSYTEGGIPYGPEDGHAYNNLPDIIRNRYILPYSLFYINDYDARYYSMLRISMEHNITSIATLNPSTIVLLCQRIGAFQDDIIKDIENGTLKTSLSIQPEIRAEIEKNLKPNPKRAKELRNILKEKKELLPEYFWPNLELIECWKGGTVKFYLNELPRYFGDTATRDFGCLSTEARSSIVMSDEGAGGVLAISTNFYEFVPKEDRDKKNKRPLLCYQLEKGKEYFLIVTTPGGLYRYNIDDVIAVDGFFNKAPVIEFVHKGHNAVSLTGEKVYESHINEAVSNAITRHNMPVKSFSACVQKEAPPRYIFLIEFAADTSKEAKKNFLITIEEELCRQNSEYDDTRKQQLLAYPILKSVKRGGFEKYRQKRVSEGAHDSQFKLPKLAPACDFYKNFDIEEEVAVDN